MTGHARSPDSRHAGAEFADERPGRPDDPLGGMGQSIFGKSECGPYRPRVEARPRGRGSAASRNASASHPKVAPKDTSRVADSEGFERCPVHRPQPRASREAQPVERSQVHRPKPIFRPRSLALIDLRRTERSKSRRTKPATRKEASRAQDGSGAASGGRTEGRQRPIP